MDQNRKSTIVAHGTIRTHSYWVTAMATSSLQVFIQSRQHQQRKHNICVESNENFILVVAVTNGSTTHLPMMPLPLSLPPPQCEQPHWIPHNLFMKILIVRCHCCHSEWTSFKGVFTLSDYVSFIVMLTGGAFDLAKQIKGAARQRHGECEEITRCE